MNKPVFGVALFVLSSAFALACSSSGGGGGAAGGGSAAQEVKATTTEFKFDGAPATLKSGQSYKFTVTNSGTVAHEFMIMPRGVTDHSKALLSITEAELAPGKTVTKEATLSQKGDFEIACHVPGHYEAGMHSNVTIS